MTHAMAHRGPDGINHWVKGSVALVRETNLPEPTFPETAPFALEQVLDDAYWPG